MVCMPCFLYRFTPNGTLDVRYLNESTVMLLIRQYFAAGAQDFCWNLNLLSPGCQKGCQCCLVFEPPGWPRSSDHPPPPPPQGKLSHQRCSCCALVTSTFPPPPLCLLLTSGSSNWTHNFSHTLIDSFCPSWVWALQVNNLAWVLVLTVVLFALVVKFQLVIGWITSNNPK